MKDTVKEYLSMLKKSGPEFEFHDAFHKVLENIEFEFSEENGFALLRVLDGASFKIGVFDSDKSEIGGLSDYSDIVACLFDKINADSDWWKYRYQGKTDFDERAVKFWIDQFKNSELVDEFII